MGKCGDPISLTLNGVKYAIPKDTTPNVIKGGLKITDTQDYGDGTSDAVISNVIAKLTGLKVKLSEDNKEAFETACATPDIPVIYECVSKTYEMTGNIVAGETEIDTTRNISGEFEVRCSDGTGIRES